MDFLHRACGGDGSRERIVRQILDETTQPHVGAIVVQRVSGIHHVSHPVGALVAEKKNHHAFPLELGDCFHLDFSLRCRFRLFLRLEPRRFDDLHCLHDSPRKRHRLLPLRSFAFPREKFEEQSRRLGSGADRDDIFILGNQIERRRERNLAPFSFGGGVVSLRLSFY